MRGQEMSRFSLTAIIKMMGVWLHLQMYGKTCMHGETVIAVVLKLSRHTKRNLLILLHL